MLASIMNRKGFTMIEMLIAIFIFGVLASGAHQILGTAVTTDEISGDKTTRLAEIQKAVSLMDRDFNQMANRNSRNTSYMTKRFIWAAKNIYDSDDWGIEFVRSGNLNPGGELDRNELSRVAYRLKHNRLERGTYTRTDPIENVQPHWEPILDKVSNFELRFRVTSGSTTWYQSINTNTLPAAVELSVTLEDVGKIIRVYQVAKND